MPLCQIFRHAFAWILISSWLIYCSYVTLCVYPIWCTVLFFSIFVDNWNSKYLEKDEVSPGVKAGKYQGEVRSDISTSFFILLEIFFPSVTGRLVTVKIGLTCYLHNFLVCTALENCPGIFYSMVGCLPSINLVGSNLQCQH